MGRLRPLLLALAAGFAFPATAQATATLTCDVDGRGIAFHVMAAVGHEALTLSGTRGELRLPREGIAVELGGAELMQTWIEGDDLRLRFHLFPEEARPEIDLTVITRRRTETDHVGRYRLTIGMGKAARVMRGAVVCVVG